jgi:hypothetical protein
MAISSTNGTTIGGGGVGMGPRRLTPGDARPLVVFSFLQPYPPQPHAPQQQQAAATVSTNGTSTGLIEPALTSSSSDASPPSSSSSSVAPIDPSIAMFQRFVFLPLNYIYTHHDCFFSSSVVVKHKVMLYVQLLVIILLDSPTMMILPLPRRQRLPMAQQQ